MITSEGSDTQKHKYLEILESSIKAYTTHWIESKQLCVTFNFRAGIYNIGYDKFMKCFCGHYTKEVHGAMI